MSNLKPGFLFFLSAYLIIVPASNMLQAWHLFLKKEVVLNQDTILLRDIGNVYGHNSNPEQTGELLHSILEYNAMDNAVLSRAQVSEILLKSGLAPETVRGESIAIKVPLKKITTEIIENQIQIDRLKNSHGQYRIQLTTDISVPEYLVYDIKIPGKLKTGVAKGYLVFANDAYKPLEFTFEVQKKAELYRLKKDLKSGDRILKDSYEKIELFSSDPALIRKQINPLGYRLTVDLKKDEQIKNEWLKKVTDVKAGQIMNLYLESGSISLSFPVRAEQSGAIGQVIRFRTKNNRYLLGEIISPGEAFVIQEYKKYVQ